MLYYLSTRLRLFGYNSRLHHIVRLYDIKYCFNAKYLALAATIPKYKSRTNPVIATLLRCLIKHSG